MLLGQRRRGSQVGTWSPPGGKPEPGETAEQTAVRELLEETGLAAGSPRVLGVTVNELDGTAWRTTFVAARWIGGEPRTTEPDTTGDWRWFAWEALPVPLFTPFGTFVRDFAAYASAIASISTSAPDGSADTSIVDRAG